MRKLILSAVSLLCFCVPLRAQDTPEMVAPGSISEDAQNEFRLIETHRGDQWMYSSTKTKGVLYTLHLTSRTSSGWTQPKRFLPSPEFQKAHVLEAFFTRSGHSLFFVSNKGGANSEDYDIWHAYIKQGWITPPKKLPELINSPAGEWFPTYQDGVLTFGSEREGGMGGIDIYQAEITYRQVGGLRHLPAPVNSPYEDFDPVISQDGSFMIFSSNRPSEYENTRLYVAFQDDDGTWSKLVNLGKELGEYSHGSAASLSADETTLYFNAKGKAPRRSGDLYAVSFQPILARLKKEAGVE